ncbi:hypothetical protein, partial [Clostridium oryzae]|uniref:hypothetical protein n=1 Tax=Clostridium oryzae TaxID=1450648 RepID=UPI00147537C9
FIIFIIPIAALGWLTYKLVGISKEKLSAIRINKITRANRKHIDKAFMHSANYEQIFKPTEFDKHNSVIDVEYKEIKR